MANSGAKHLYKGMNKENGRNPERFKLMRDGAVETNNVGPRPRREEDEAEWRRWQKVWLMGPSVDRQMLRSRTDPNVAEAMAAQWGPLLPGDHPAR